MIKKYAYVGRNRYQMTSWLNTAKHYQSVGIQTVAKLSNCKLACYDIVRLQQDLSNRSGGKLLSDVLANGVTIYDVMTGQTLSPDDAEPSRPWCTAISRRHQRQLSSKKQTDANKVKVNKLLRDGYTIGEIQQATGLTKRMIMQAIHTPERPLAIPKQDTNKIKQLLANRTCEEVASETGLNINTLRKFASKHGGVKKIREDVLSNA